MQDINKPKWWLRPLVLELFISTIFAVAAIAPPLDDSKTALTIAAIGVMFGAGRYAMQELIKESLLQKVDDGFASLGRLIDVVDFSSNASIRDIKALSDSYFRITHHEFSEIKYDIVASASEKLNKLLSTERSENLDTSDYYKILIQILNSAKEGQTIYAVSTGNTVEWEDTPEEENFFQANLDIINRGGRVIRYFVYDKEDLRVGIANNSKIAQHFGSGKLTGYFIDKAKLQTKDKNLFASIGQGFLMVENKIVIVDVFDSDGPRGFITKSIYDISVYSKTVERLNNLSSRTVN